MAVLGDVEPFSGDRLFDGQIVSVADPANCVRIVAVAVGELRRTPAVNRPADELLRADEKAEADQDDDGVLTTEAVDVVIVHTELKLTHAQHRLKEAIHDGGRTNERSRVDSCKSNGRPR